MRTSETTAKIYAAMARAQGATTHAIKDNTNPAFRSKYADMTAHVDVIRPVAAAEKLSVFQELTTTPEGVAVTTRIAHESGEWIEFGPFVVPVGKHDAHGVGSASSYARRYALSAAWGTVADDDDGNAAVQHATRTVVDVTTGEDVPVSGRPAAPEGFHYVTGYRLNNGWHEATVLGWDLQGGGLRVSTKKAQVGTLLGTFCQSGEPVRVDVTMKKGTRGEAYLNDVQSYTVASAPPQAERLVDIELDAIPFTWLAALGVSLMGVLTYGS
jgi:hypothetical protein